MKDLIKKHEDSVDFWKQFYIHYGLKLAIYDNSSLVSDYHRMSILKDVKEAKNYFLMAVKRLNKLKNGSIEEKC